jgi:hypothetical protein
LVWLEDLGDRYCVSSMFGLQKAKGYEYTHRSCLELSVNARKHGLRIQGKEMDKYGTAISYIEQLRYRMRISEAYHT